MKDRAVTPIRTYALVVGIEKYALGSGLAIDLDGPAHNALTFAGWLAYSHHTYRFERVLREIGHLKALMLIVLVVIHLICLCLSTVFSAYWVSITTWNAIIPRLL